jgi:uncharacterized protein YegP (UPF0339 family)
MRKIVHSLVLVAAIAGLVLATSANNTAPAQAKKAKVTEVEVGADVGTIEITTDKQGKWRFRVRFDDKIIAQVSTGYAKKEDLLKVLDTVKTTMAKGKVVEIKSDKKE